MLEPKERITLEEIEEHEFLRGWQAGNGEGMGYLPVSCLAVPPRDNCQSKEPPQEHIPKIDTTEVDPHEDPTILNKSILLKDSSHNYDSEYLE